MKSLPSFQSKQQSSYFLASQLNRLPLPGWPPHRDEPLARSADPCRYNFSREPPGQESFPDQLLPPFLESRQRIPGVARKESENKFHFWGRNGCRVWGRRTPGYEI